MFQSEHVVDNVWMFVFKPQSVFGIVLVHFVHFVFAAAAAAASANLTQLWRNIFDLYIS